MLRHQKNLSASGFPRPRVMAWWVSLLVGWGCVFGWQRASAAQVDADQLEAVVQYLIEESGRLDVAAPASQAPVTVRPHPKVKSWPVEMAPAALERVAKRLTGNPHRDAYIRWHLMWVVRRGIEQQLAQGNFPEGLAPHLAVLADQMPAPSPYKIDRRPRGASGAASQGKTSGTRVTDDPLWEPMRKLREKIDRLHGKSRVTVGYPPFEKNYYLKDALAHAPAARKPEIKKIISQVKALKAQRQKLMNDNPQLQKLDELRLKQQGYESKRNLAMNRLNDLFRAYRAEVAYSMAASGDAQSLQAVAQRISQRINDRQRVGFDLTAGLYAAAYDGALAQYDAKTLRAVRATLNQVARKRASYTTYREGQGPIPHRRESRRNFADYAFNLLELLDHPHDLRAFVAPDTKVSSPAPRKSAAQSYQAQSLTIDQVHQAIERAIRTLHQSKPAQRLARYGLQSDANVFSTRLSGSPLKRQNTFHASGNLAVQAWAMLAAGESYQDPRMLGRIHRALSSDTPYVYDRAMRSLMMGQLSAQRWGGHLQRDTAFLIDAMSNADTGLGGFQDAHFGQTHTTWGDHANGQYALLGLWSASRAGIKIPPSVWKRLDTQWRATQQQTPGLEPAGWALAPLNVKDDSQSTPRGRARRITAPMTAGGVAALSLTERFLGASRSKKAGTSPALQKGLAWLNQHFSVDEDVKDVGWFYYMWTIQRVGQASGYRTFNGQDWFRQATTQILNRQNRQDGLWTDPSGLQPARTASAFALLYLGSALDPLAISKVRYDGRWNDRPHDLWNFAEWASHQYERGTTWQIADLNQPVYELIESPLLFLSAAGEVNLPDAQMNRLRDYLTAGGTLILNPDQNTAKVTGSMRRLAEKLYPGQTLEKIENDHRFYTIHQQVGPRVQMNVVSNGIRPLIVQLARDIGQGLEDNQADRGESFHALSNLYLYSVGKNPRRSRLGNHHLPDSQAPTRQAVSAARIRYQGNDDPEPGALSQLRNLMRQAHGIDFKYIDTDPRQLSPDTRIAFLTTTGQGDLTDEQIDALGQWLSAGGTLWLDAAGGSQAAVIHAQAILSRLAPQQAPMPLPSIHPIVTGVGLPGQAYDNRRASYRRFALGQMGPTRKPRLQAIMIDDRPAILYSPEDITSGLAGLEHWGIFGYSVASARQLVANSVLHVIQSSADSTMKR